jgi:hypothetical protein
MAAEPSPLQRGHDKGRMGLAGALRCHQATLWPFSFRALPTQNSAKPFKPRRGSEAVPRLGGWFVWEPARPEVSRLRDFLQLFRWEGS